MAERRAEVMRYRVGKRFQFFISGLKLSGPFSKFFVEHANFMLPPISLGDVVVGLQNRNRGPVVVATQRPPARYHHAASIRLCVLELAFPATCAQQLGIDLVKGCREDSLQQTVGGDLADHFPCPPTVKLLRSAVPECNDVANVTYANGIVREIEQSGPLSSFSYFSLEFVAGLHKISLDSAPDGGEPRKQ